MAKRIRYIPTTEEGKLTSLQSFNGYMVTLNLKEKTYLIHSGHGGFAAEHHKGTVKGGDHKLKMAAKKKLQELGIDFQEEKRKPKRGVDNV